MVPVWRGRAAERHHGAHGAAARPLLHLRDRQAGPGRNRPAAGGGVRPGAAEQGSDHPRDRRLHLQCHVLQRWRQA